MDATDRVASEFEGLVALGREGVILRPITERYLYYIVATRCDIDIGGFASAYEQNLTADELQILIDGLDRIGERELAGEFRRGYELLRADGFYQDHDLKRISQTTYDEIDAIGRFIADQLWDLDDKLANLLDDVAGPDTQ